MLTSLRIQRDLMALEAFSIVDVQTLLKNVFPTVRTEFQSFVSRFAPDHPALAITSKQSDFLSEVNKHSYLDIAPIAAFVPEGLATTYFRYSEVLLQAAEHSSKTTLQELSAFSVFLSQLITNADRKFSTTEFLKSYQALEHMRGELNKDLGSCFKRGSTATETTIGAVVERNAEWPHVFHNADQITKLMNSVDRNALNRKVAECVELLEIITKKMERNEFEGISPQAVNNLADGTYQIAAELEMFSAVFYKVLSYTEAVNRTVVNFKNVFNNH